MSVSTQLTEQQQAAISTRGVSVALDAGAGCGKTFVLTERFLSHLDPRLKQTLGESPAGLHELIAITFTDAAAREMRRRIRQACLDRLHSADGDEGDYWLALVRSLDAARINTIHGFCSSLVRSHAVQLGVDPLFRVLDSGAADVLRSEATDQTLRRRLNQRDEMVMRLAAEFDLRGLRQRLAGLLNHAGETGFAEWLDRDPQEAVDAWREAYGVQFAESVVARVGESTALRNLGQLLPKAAPEKQRFIDTRPALIELVERFLEGEAKPTDLPQLAKLARVQGVCTAKDWPQKEDYEQYKQACEQARKLANEFKPLADDTAALRSATLGCELLRLTSDVADDIAETKRQRGLLEFDDLLTEAKRLLTDPQFVDAQRRLRDQIRLLLVDEFQDTDRTQMAIVKALVGDSHDAGRLFFVGDFKQSIYRFRGAEPDVFRELQAETPAAGRLPLAMNFRSQPAVLEFVNTLFAPTFGNAYIPLDAKRPQTTASPAVEMMWTPTEDATSAGAARKAEADAIARRLRSMFDEQTPLVGERDDAGAWRPRVARPGDCAILFRALSDVPYYEQALRDQAIPYQLIGGHAFYAQQEVQDVANLLRSIASGCDEVALAGVLRSPLFSLLDETLYWLATTSGGLSAGFSASTIPAELSEDEAKKLTHARETLNWLRQRKGTASIAELLNAAIDRTSYDAVLLSEFLGERKLANLQKLLEQARAFDALRPGDLDGFVRQLAEFVAKEPKEALAATRSDETDQVRLMTVHVAKGLEFSVVVLADINRKQQGDRDPVAFHPELGPVVRSESDNRGVMLGIDLQRAITKVEDQAESNRLFYVACTRAADYLILSAAYEPDAKPEGPWMPTLAERFDLTTGELREPVYQALEGPLVKVQPPPSGQRSQSNDAGGVNRRKLLEAAASSPSADMPALVASIPLHAAEIRQFSVSKLTGQLQHASRRPAAVGVEAALVAPNDEVDPRGLGTLVHAILERVALTAENPLKLWSDSLAPLHVTRHAELAAKQAEELVRRFLHSPRCEQMRAAARVDREVEFLLQWPPGEASVNVPSAFLQGYIDCLTQNSAGEWTVLDYKTNRIDAAGVTSAAEQYRLQLYVYAMAVEQATGQAPTELCIHFMRPGVEVSFEWDSAARNQARELVNQAIAGVRAQAVQDEIGLADN